MSLGLIDGGSLLPISSMLESREKIFLYWFFFVCITLLDIRRNFFRGWARCRRGLCERRCPSVNPAMGGMMIMPGINVGSVDVTREAGLGWREKTGWKTGFLIKVDEVRVMAVKGRRCRECGCIELYVNKET